MSIKCPICNKSYDELDKLAACITQHDEDLKVQQQKVQEANNIKIKSLKAQNVTLLEQLEKNCRELQKLGVNAVMSYKIKSGDPEMATETVTKTTPVGTKTTTVKKSVNSNDVEKNLGKAIDALLGGGSTISKVTSKRKKEIEDDLGSMMSELNDILGELLGGK